MEDITQRDIRGLPVCFCLAKAFLWAHIRAGTCVCAWMCTHVRAHTHPPLPCPLSVPVSRARTQRASRVGLGRKEKRASTLAPPRKRPRRLWHFPYQRHQRQVASRWTPTEAGAELSASGRHSAGGGGGSGGSYPWRLAARNTSWSHEISGGQAPPTSGLFFHLGTFLPRTAGRGQGLAVAKRTEVLCEAFERSPWPNPSSCPSPLACTRGVGSSKGERMSWEPLGQPEPAWPELPPSTRACQEKPAPAHPQSPGLCYRMKP